MKMLRAAALAASLMFIAGCAGEAMPSPAQPLAVFPDSLPQGISTFDSLGCSSDRAFARLAYTGSGYAESKGRAGGTVTADPYFTLSAGGTDIPVYAVPVCGTPSTGAIHSFASLRSSLPELSVNASASFSITSADVITCETASLSLSDGGFSASLSGYGFYTFFFNDSASCRYSLTLSVRPAADEQAEIDEYIARWGADNVTVYEPGIYSVESIPIRSNSVLYLKEGAYLLAEHKFDMTCAEDRKNTDGLFFIGASDFENVTVAGHGTVDLSRLDLHERIAVQFMNGKNLTLKDITLINSGHWNVYIYRVDGVRCEGLNILASRINSDGINICNCLDASVENCFVRCGDDCFSVKTLGAGENSPASGITFSRCIAWAAKARCFGITGEVNFDIRDVLFENCAVVTREGVWDNDRIGSLVIVKENGVGGLIENVAFRNISIYRDRGRALLLSVLGGSSVTMENISFENITASAKMPCMLLAGSEENSISASVKNCLLNGATLSPSDFIADTASCSVK